MFTKLKNWWNSFSLSLRAKLTLSLSAIAMVLLISSVITILQYRSMSNYVSDMIADDIQRINVAQSLVNAVDSYNLGILTVIGDDSINSLPDFDQQRFVYYCDSLKMSFNEQKPLPLADSVLYSFSAYMLTSLELEDVIKSDFIDSRTWYFERLQPVFNRLRSDIDGLSQVMYADLRENSENFDSGFYRSVIPGAVAVGMGIVLVFLLMFFLMVYYVNPLYGMLQGMDNYRRFGRKYSFQFEGDDQLKDLNNGITEVVEENRQLHRRIKALKENAASE